jgi:hypothetical protein
MNYASSYNIRIMKVPALGSAENFNNSFSVSLSASHRSMKINLNILSIVRLSRAKIFCLLPPRASTRLIHIKMLSVSLGLRKHFQCQWPTMTVDGEIKLESVTSKTMLEVKDLTNGSLAQPLLSFFCSIKVLSGSELNESKPISCCDTQKLC